MKDRHFSLTEFVAYRQGSLPRRMVEMLEKHVRDGCPACESDLRFAGQLAEVAARERAATPPPAVLERARAVFRAPQPSPGLDTALVGLGRLVFDSCLQPAPAGVRGAMRLDRHMVFSERDLMLDMHIEPVQEADFQSITGQVQSKAVRQDQLTGLPVLLLEGGRVVMSTHTNRHGEFLFSMAPRREMTVCLVCSDRQVRIPCPPSVAVE